jgi:magnesium chelatase family protein
VIAARARQLQRQGVTISELSGAALDEHCRFDTGTAAFLEAATQKLGLSARAYHRVLRVARTLADLNGSVQISQAQVAEAIGYRQLDRRQ